MRGVDELRATKGTVWFAGAAGVHPEITIDDGKVVPHDAISWVVCRSTGPDES